MLFTFRPASATSWDAAHIVMQSLETGERVVLIEGGRDARYVETGHLVYALNGVLTAIAFDLDAGKVLGGPVPLVEGVRDTGNATGAAQFSVARNGSLVYMPGASGGARGGNTSLAWVTRSGEDTPMAAPVRAYGDPRVSPDGTRVAISVFEQDNIDVWIWHLDDGPLTRLTFDQGLDAFPLWTPDSSRVVFRSTRDGGGLFWRAADGTGAVERLLESANDPWPWGWSTDGRLVFDQSPGDIGVLTVEGDRTVEMLLETGFDERAPALSPDGRWIAYQSDESGGNEIYVQPFPNVDDGKWQVSTNAGVDPVWSPDGRHLFFVTFPPRMMVAEVETEPTFSPGTPTEAFDLSAYQIAGGGRRYDLAPDGERFILRRSGGPQTPDGDAFSGLIFVENWFQELTERGASAVALLKRAPRVCREGCAALQWPQPFTPSRGGAAMTLSRRKALSLSGSTLAAVSLGVLKPDRLQARQAPGQQDWPDQLEERPLRDGFPATLPLNADGSAPEHPEGAAGAITDPLMWRTSNRETPEIEFDYREMRIRVDTRGLARLAGTLRFSDLEQLPSVSGTFLLQCGAPNPRGIVKWTGVRFSDFADMLGLIPEAHYCRFVASDRFYADEPLTTLRHPQVMLAWFMNDEPIPPRHGAPLRLIIPFRYGNRSVKAITEMTFSTPGPRMPPLPA